MDYGQWNTTVQPDQSMHLKSILCKLRQQTSQVQLNLPGAGSPVCHQHSHRVLSRSSWPNRYVHHSVKLSVTRVFVEINWDTSTKWHFKPKNTRGWGLSIQNLVWFPLAHHLSSSCPLVQPFSGKLFILKITMKEAVARVTQNCFNAVNERMSPSIKKTVSRKPRHEDFPTKPFKILVFSTYLSLTFPMTLFI